MYKTKWHILVLPPLLIVLVLFCSGCADKEVRNSSLWLKNMTAEVTTNINQYKTNRDNIAKSRQLSTNAFEYIARTIEEENEKEMSVWIIENIKKNPKISFYENLIKVSKNLEQHQQKWALLHKEHNEKVNQAKSTIKINTTDLAKTVNYLSELGSGPKFKEEVKFYADFLYSVNKKISELEKNTQEEQQSVITKTLK